MTKVSAVDAKQKRTFQLQQLLADKKSSAPHNMLDSFLVKKLNYCRQKAPGARHSLPIPSPAQTPADTIHQGLVHGTESQDMFVCKDLTAANQSPHSCPVSPSEITASLKPGNTPLKLDC